MASNQIEPSIMMIEVSLFQKEGRNSWRKVEYEVSFDAYLDITNVEEEYLKLWKRKFQSVIVKFDFNLNTDTIFKDLCRRIDERNDGVALAMDYEININDRKTGVFDRLVVCKKKYTSVETLQTIETRECVSVSEGLIKRLAIFKTGVVVCYENHQEVLRGGTSVLDNLYLVGTRHSDDKIYIAEHMSGLNRVYTPVKFNNGEVEKIGKSQTVTPEDYACWDKDISTKERDRLCMVITIEVFQQKGVIPFHRHRGVEMTVKDWLKMKTQTPPSPPPAVIVPPPVELITCKCGCEVVKNNIAKHKKTEKHKTIMRKLKEVEEQEKHAEENTCIVCMDNTRMFANTKCGHRALCEGCVEEYGKAKIRECPLCRVSGGSWIKIHL